MPRVAVRAGQVTLEIRERVDQVDRFKCAVPPSDSRLFQYARILQAGDRVVDGLLGPTDHGRCALDGDDRRTGQGFDQPVDRRVGTHASEPLTPFRLNVGHALLVCVRVIYRPPCGGSEEADPRVHSVDRFL
jgi:hypothetical protein